MVRGSERSRRLSPTIIHLVRLPLERQGCRDPERCGGGSHSATGAVLRETSCIRGAGTPVASQSVAIGVAGLIAGADSAGAPGRPGAESNAQSSLAL